MMYYTLHIGDVVTSFRHAHYTCFGLGSCIGLFIHDRVTGLSGGAHILLPEDEPQPNELLKFYTVVTALDEILRQFTWHGNNLTTLCAKVAGGASVVSANIKTGGRNVQSVVNQLIARKIFIAALEVGGRFCRTATFESKTGQLTVRFPETNEYKIY